MSQLDRLNRYKKFLGDFHSSYVGYAKAEEDRKRVASGGIVTTLSRFLLTNQIVDGVALSRAVFRNGALDYDFSIVTNPEEVSLFGTSVYFDIPIEKHLSYLQEFKGKLAICCLPCHAKMIRRTQIQKKKFDNIILLISLFCGHNNSKELFRFVFNKYKIDEKHAREMWIARTYLGGNIHIRNEFGKIETFSFRCLNVYRSLGLFSKKMCKYCDDHLGCCSDISVGDIYLKEFKKDDIKSSSILIRTKIGETIFNQLKDSSKIYCQDIDPSKIHLSQKRILVPSNDHKSRYYACTLLGYAVNKKVFLNKNFRIRSFVTHSLILLNNRLSEFKIGLMIFRLIPLKVWCLYIGVIKLINHTLKPR